MNMTSPSKRRALAPLDANTRSPLGTPRPSPSKLNLPKSKMSLGTSLVEPNTIKRPAEQENSGEMPGPAKRRRLSNPRTEPLSPRSDDEKLTRQGAANPPRPRSTSPEDSSVFDHSTADNSQVTAPSEPDAETTTPPVVTETRPRPRSMTREEARQKAEILRLRLGLASYKVRTNQADVPLERLQARRVLGKFVRPGPSTVLLPPLPPLPGPSPRGTTTAPRRNAEKKSRSPAGSEVPSSQTVVPVVPLHRRNESGSSAPRSDVGEPPARIQELEQNLPDTILNTPERKLTERGGEALDNERGGAAEGLLSLSQSSPASTVK
ncbi:putative cyclin-dependent kinase protein [Rosellinia necatrix]|uniref:Putative cyclin-dependent kinase protein n=1 Tax=Rosellinia necatrix TaxID=77044 RepID=A0A1W2TH12_ROSNE|nr:putative cyclin-dependent kinase protein [Rosellinia necatrix]